jgi:hypothetical protein
LAKGEGEMAKGEEGGSKGKDDKPKAKESAKHAKIEEDVAWMAYISDSKNDEGSVDWWDEPVEGRKKSSMNESTKQATSPSPNHPNPKPLPQKEWNCLWHYQRSRESVG